MSERIGKAPAKPSKAAAATAPAAASTSRAAPLAPAGGAAAATDAAARDLFEHQGGPIGSRIETRLQSTAGLGAAARRHFSSEDMASLAATLATIVSQFPAALRQQRAHLFARAILRRKRLRHLFSGLTEAEMETMCDVIGDVLDSSPLFGQLVDDVAEDAGKT